MKIINKIFQKKMGLLLIGIIAATTCYADQDLISLFPIEHYDQTISTWIKPTDPNFDKPLLSADTQQKRLELFYAHYFGETSPWSASYVNSILRQSPPNNLVTIEQNILRDFSNENKPDNQIGYGENFRPHSKEWIDAIANNINLTQFSGLSYQASRRGIAVENLQARALPTSDVHFFSHRLAGQGYPFDNLQMSALWAGTPVYIVGESLDHAWMLVITPEYVAWVKSKGIAYANNAFIHTWTNAANRQLLAITHTNTSLTDDRGNFLLSAYVGAVFPGRYNANNAHLMVPIADGNHRATFQIATIPAENATPMPLTITPHHFSTLMSTLIGRPYGWGSMYFYNDCSAELKSLFTPFGIWLPRHSAYQVNEGKMVDMSAAPQDKRLAYLMENGQPFLTLIYIGGHVVLYIGNYSNPNQTNSLMAMTYQNLWGLSPNPPIRRAVIGQSVLFPMLLQYPEDPTLMSLAGKKYFQVSYLSQLPTADFLLKEKAIDLKALMYPDLMLHD